MNQNYLRKIFLVFGIITALLISAAPSEDVTASSDFVSLSASAGNNQITKVSEDFWIPAGKFIISVDTESSANECGSLIVNNNFYYSVRVYKSTSSKTLPIFTYGTYVCEQINHDYHEVVVPSQGTYIIEVTARITDYPGTFTVNAGILNEITFSMGSTYDTECIDHHSSSLRKPIVQHTCGDADDFKLIWDGSAYQIKNVTLNKCLNKTTYQDRLRFDPCNINSARQKFHLIIEKDVGVNSYSSIDFIYFSTYTGNYVGVNFDNEVFDSATPTLWRNY